MSVIFILWLRQLKRYYRSKAKIAGSLAQPVLFFVALGFGFGPIFKSAGQGDFLQFLAPGIIAMSILFSSISSGTETIWDRQFGFLKEALVAPIPRLSIVIGKALGGATVAVIQGVIIFGITLTVGFRPESWLMAAAGFAVAFLMALVFSALGLVMASFLNDVQGFQMIMIFLIIPMFFLSGALYPLKGLPRFLIITAKANPVSYGVDGLRAAFLGSSHFPFLLDLGVLIVLAGALMFISAYLFSRVQL